MTGRRDAAFEAERDAGRIPEVPTSVVTGVLYSSDRTRVTRVLLDDGGRTAGTLIRKEAFGLGGPGRIRHEVAIMQRLGGVPGIPRLSSVTDDGTALATEDAGGVPLAEVVRAGGLDPAWVTRFACRLAGLVAGVHRAGVVHKDINPANVLLAPDGAAPQLIDFDLATTFAEERPSFTHHSEIVGTLAYLAPEQTGRTGRPVDNRADLYAIGATLYELLTGRPPFGAGNPDPLRLIHAHLAQVPESPSAVNAAIPRTLSAIVLRLLEKEPDRRYQSAEGLARDLARLRGLLDAGDPDPQFVLGGQDFPLRLAAPSRLVGREEELAALTAAYRGIREGGSRGLLVCGAPGVGKTVLLDELRGLATEHGGWFVTGKFDQYRQDLATDAVAQALRGLGRLLLAEPDEALTEHRTRLLAALGSNAGMLATLPEFAALLRVTPVAPEGDPAQIATRMYRIFLDLLRTIATPDRPVVIVLDDLQWATAFPIGLIDAVLTEEDLSGVLLVGAFRDAEVSPAHPLSAMLARWTRLAVVPPQLTLRNLPSSRLAALLGEMLRLPASEAGELAESIGARTGGNPYDTVELVNALRRDGALVLTDHGWSWDTTAIRRHIGTADVVELLVARIDRLPKPSRHLLRILACLGGEIELPRLAMAADTSEEEARDHLTAALEDGLLVPVSLDESQTYGAVRFRHDRVQQAAYASLRDDDRQKLELALARRLSGRPECVGLAAEQYLRVIDHVDDPSEVRRAAALLLAAAAESRIVNALTAETLLAAAAVALDRVDATADEPLWMDVRRERHAVLYALGRLAEADELYDVIAAHCEDPVALVDAATFQISSLTHRDRHREALALGMGLLKRLHIDVPAPDELGPVIGQGLVALREWAEGNDVAEDIARPTIDDPRLIAVARVINRLMPAAYFSDHTAMAWLTLEARRIWAEHGPCEHLLGPIAHAGALTIAVQNDYRTGYIAVRQVVAVGEARGFEPATSQALFLLSVCSTPWFESIETVAEQARRAREGLLRGGDLQHAAYTYSSQIPPTLDFAQTIEASLGDIENGMAFAARVGHDSVGYLNAAFRQLVRTLRGQTVQPGSFQDESFDEAEYLERVSHNPPASVGFHSLRALAAAILSDQATLTRHAHAAAQLEAATPGLYSNATSRFLSGLAAAQQLRAAKSPGESHDAAHEAAHEAALTRFGECRDWLAARAADVPVNYGHLVDLLDAERAWALGEAWQAAIAFDAAIHQVASRSRPWQQALITERAARFHLEHGLEHAGHRLLAEARGRYARWGAVAKVRQLDQEFPELRDAAQRGDASTGRQSASRSIGADAAHSVVMSAESIDLVGVLRASQALSQETNLDRLRGRVVDVLTMMTGATGVHLVLWNDESADWFLPAGEGATEQVITVAEAGRRGKLAISAFRYAERTREPLRVADATRDDRFSRDPYLADVACCSLLVVPILSHGEPRAMLVLENRLSRGAFSSDRLDAVMLIAGQLAVCLDNALAERFRSLVQRSSELTLVCDGTGTISYASSAAMDLLGVEESALLGRSVMQLVAREDRPAVVEWLAAHHGGAVSGQRPDGTALTCHLDVADDVQRWAEVSCTDLTADPAVGGLMLRLRDITERRRLETELRHAQKMESVGQLSAGIAHEINTPIQFIGDNVRFLTDAFNDLAGVLTGPANAASGAAIGVDSNGATNAASAGSTGGVDVDYLLEEIPQALRDTLDGATRVATIVRAMKAFGHPGGEDKAYANLNDAIRNTLVVATSEIRHVAEVELDLDEGLPMVWCNLGDINQVVLNLVINAAHAMGEKQAAGGGSGTLTVRTRAEGDEILLQVQDTGAGIPAEIADRVFDQFFTTKQVGVGTGQGLALAYTLIHDHHGGTISFESTVGVGTTFTVRLPNPPDEAADA